MKTKILLLFFVPNAFCHLSHAGTIAQPNAFQSGGVISSSQMNANFNALVSELNAKDARILALEAASTAAPVPKYSVYTVANNTTLLTSYATTVLPLVQLYTDTTGGALSMGPAANAITINTAGVYRVNMTWSSTGCDTPMEISYYLNGVETGQATNIGPCTGSTMEWVESLSAGDVVSFTARWDQPQVQSTTATQKLVKIAFYPMF
jgi:hypothetical protein